MKMIEKIWSILKAHFPFLGILRREMSLLPLRVQKPENIFTKIYSAIIWGDQDSLSGSGSNKLQTEVIRKAIPILPCKLNCKSFLDIPYGDFFWMRMVDLGIPYIRGDTVPQRITQNQERYGNCNRVFINVNIINGKLPMNDIILCRDCFVHFSYLHIIQALKNIKQSGGKYLLTTTFIEHNENKDIPTGDRRTINLNQAPFNFPTPLGLIDEKCPILAFTDNNLGLWKVSDIPEY